MGDIRYIECKAGRYVDLGNGVYRCPQCGFENATRVGMGAHMVSHQNLHLVCEKCGREFRNRRALGRHMGSSHRVQEEVDCDLCGERFKNRRALGNHKAESHNYLVSRTCEICGRECSGWASYQNHINMAHNEEVRGRCSEAIRGGRRRSPKRRSGGLVDEYRSSALSFSQKVWWMLASDDEKRELLAQAHTDDAQRKRRASVIRTWSRKTVEDLAGTHKRFLDGRTKHKYSVENRSGEEVGCDSLIEAGLCEAMLLDDSVKNFDRCFDVIPITGMRATYNPDFVVELADGTTEVIEVKGRLGWEDEELRRLPFKAESATAFYRDRGVTYRIVFAKDVGDYRSRFGLSRRATVDDLPISDNR